jgi:predicted metal-dependent phosphoesterase TrpH
LSTGIRTNGAWHAAIESGADLHTHSLHSDGACTPEVIVARAAELGIRILSITDHDSVSGIEEATQAGRRLGVTIVPGIELSATLEHREVHILGYFVDIANKKLQQAISVFREDRLRRAERMVKKLNGLKAPVTMASVQEQAGSASIGRPHVAKALVAGGFVESYYQAFVKYIGDNGPGYEPRAIVTPEQQVELIANAGGLSFVAHPGRSMTEEELVTLIKAGVDGIEVIHPSHSPDLVKHYKEITNQYYLLQSGGSDFHGGLRGDDDQFGRFMIPAETVQRMRTFLPHTTA